MSPRPTIFISAVSKELKSSRQLVSNTLQFLGYEPVWQDIFGTEQGDLRAVLREKVDDCKGVVQLVGKCYGAEPAEPHESFGRVSYTQYEALYAKQRGKKVWYLFLEDDFPGDTPEAEPDELRELQATYRRRLKSESQLYHPLNSREGLEASVLKLRDDLARLRRGSKQWAAAVMVLLVFLVGAAVWLKRGQQQESRDLAAMKEEMTKLRQGVTQYAEVQTKVRQEQPGQNAAEMQQRTYQELAKQLGVDPKVLQEKLPQFARELKTAADASTYERANAAYVAKDYNEAERLALVAADEAEKASSPKTHNAIQALMLAGYSADARIEYAEALKHYRHAEQLTDRARDPLEWARQQENIVFVLNEQGNYAEAEKTCRLALEACRRALSEEDADVLELRNNLIGALLGQAQFAEAESECREVIKLEGKAPGPEHPITLRSRHFLGAALLRQGKYAEAEAEYRVVLKLREKILGPEHPDTLKSRMNLANALDYQGKHAEAEAEFQALLKLKEKILGPEHPDTLNSRAHLAYAINYQGKHAEAEAEFRAVLKLEEKVLGPEHPNTLGTRNGLAISLLDQRKYAEAEAEYRAALKLREKVLGQEHLDTLDSRDGLARALNDQGKHTAAETEFRAVLKLREKALGTEHPGTLASRDGLAWVLHAQGKYAEAVTEFRAVLKLREKLLGPEHPDTLRTREGLAWALDAQGKQAEAETEFRTVIELREKLLGQEHPETLRSGYHLALCLRSENKLEEAKTFAQRAAEGAQKVLGANHPDTLSYKKLWQELQAP